MVFFKRRATVPPVPATAFGGPFGGPFGSPFGGPFGNSVELLHQHPRFPAALVKRGAKLCAQHGKNARFSADASPPRRGCR